MSHRLHVVQLLRIFFSKKVESITVPSINRLPVELLVQIFFLSEKQTYKSRYPHLRFSWVCRYWRQIINGFGGFWTVIQFSPWKDKEFIRELVSRSGSTRLSVFSPLSSDLRPWKMFRRNDNLSSFKKLLKNEGNRIALLVMKEDLDGRLLKAIIGKKLPAMKTFICQFAPSNKVFAIINSALNLQNLQITLFFVSSLSQLKPSFERLRRLNIRLPSSGSCTREFFTRLPLFINLESLTIFTRAGDDPEIEEFYMRSGAILPNLTALKATCYTLIEQLRAPALRLLDMTTRSHAVGLPRQNYLIFNDYDLSSITHLFVRGVDNAGMYQDSIVNVSGSIGPECTLPRSWDLDDKNLDLRGNLLSPSLTPIQFSIYVRARYTSLSSNSPFFSKVFPKLHKLEILFIAPFDPSWDPPRNIGISDLEFFRMFLKDILDNLSSTSQVQSLTFTELRFYPDLLRLMFDIINSYSCLSNLKTIYLISWTLPFGGTNLGDDLGEHLVRSLRRRQEAGYKPLQELSILTGKDYTLSWKWVMEAAILGTRLLVV